MQYIHNYNQIIRDMKIVLRKEPQVHVDKGIIKEDSHAETIAKDLDLQMRFDEVDGRYYFSKKL